MGNFDNREDSETTVAPLRPRLGPSDRAAIFGRGSRETGTRKPPAWVVGYLLLCAALTTIGLIVLYFEHRMLGGSPP
jgi:hypothetical protein